MDTIVLIDIYLTGCILSYPFMLGYWRDWGISRSLNDPRISFEDFGILWQDDFDGQWNKCLYQRKVDYIFSIVISLFSWITLMYSLFIGPFCFKIFPRPRFFLSKLPDKEEFREFVRN